MSKNRVAKGTDRLRSASGGHDNMIGDVEKLLGKVVVLAGGVAGALGAFDRTPKAFRGAEKDLRSSLGEAVDSTGRLYKSTRRYLRKHPWRSLALLAATGLVAAYETSKHLAPPPATRRTARRPAGTASTVTLTAKARPDARG